jgi:hypothetical protein
MGPFFFKEAERIGPTMGTTPLSQKVRGSIG